MKLAPLCRYCGGPIAKRTRLVYLVTKLDERYHKSTVSGIRYLEVPALPKTKAECQKLTNYTVVSVSRAKEYDRYLDAFVKTGIKSFTEWDGESYEARYFCNGHHAKDFAMLMAQNGRSTVTYVEAVKKQQTKLEKGNISPCQNSATSVCG